MWNGRPREARKRKPEGKGEPGEAAAENDAGGRRKEIADEAIRETACVEAEKLKPPFHEKWKKKASESRSEDRGFFVYMEKQTTGAVLKGGSCCLPYDEFLTEIKYNDSINNMIILQNWERKNANFKSDLANCSKHTGNNWRNAQEYVWRILLFSAHIQKF